MRVKVAVVVVAVIATVLSTSPQSSEAYSPYENITDCGSEVKFAFDGPHWTNGSSDIRPNARQYINSWEAEYNHNGTRVVDMVESFSEIVLQYHNPSHFSSTTTFGHAHACTGIHLNNAYAANFGSIPATWWDDFRAVLQHEFGHVMEMEHTGDDDTFDGRTPIMSTCVSSFETGGVRTISQDDTQNLQHQTGILTPQTMTANLGFNRGTSYFAKSGSTQWFVDSSVRLQWRPNTNPSGYFYQTTAAARATAESGNQSYRARINWARVAWGNPGTVYVRLYARPVTYGDQTASCAYESGWDQNSLRTPGPWYYKAGASAFSSGAPTSLATQDTLAATMTSQFVDLQIRVTHSIKWYSGVSQYVAFDNVRVRCAGGGTHCS
ncbi:MAG: hypothetical protein GWP47_08095 [Actinobacteria bacterium]|nr:hypothetical protein [Actinomycetota bacterium]